MVIKYAAPEDKQSIKDIWSICFPEDHDPFLSWFFDNVYKPSNTLVAYEDNAIAANLQLIPYKINFHNISINIKYLVGAATLPEFRKKGIMAKLLKYAIEDVSKNECPFILLLPFNYDFYRKYGWEACYFHNQYNTAIPNIGKPLNYSGYVSSACNAGSCVNASSQSNADSACNTSITRTTEKDYAPSCIPALDNIYRKFNAHKNGWILRTNSDWLNIIQDHHFSNGHIRIFSDNNGAQTGYLLYKIENTTLEVVEMAYLNLEAAAGLWNYMLMQSKTPDSAHSITLDKLVWKSPIDDISYMFFDDPRNACSVEPFVMARAVNVEKILQLLLSKTNLDISIYLNISDPLASWNNGIFHIDKASGKSTIITKMTSKSSEIDAVCLSINTFSMLSMGVISPAQAKQYGLIDRISEDQFLEINAIFKKTVNFMNEYF